MNVEKLNQMESAARALIFALEVAAHRVQLLAAMIVEVKAELAADELEQDRPTRHEQPGGSVGQCVGSSDEEVGMASEYIVLLRRSPCSGTTARRMRLVAIGKVMDTLNELQRKITELWLEGFLPVEISKEVDQPVFIIRGWIATVETLIDIESRRLRRTYVYCYGRQGWIEM